MINLTLAITIDNNVNMVGVMFMFFTKLAYFYGIIPKNSLQSALLTH